MGAYGLTVAAAFAVALAVLLSVSTTTAEAALGDKDGNDLEPANTANPGDTVYVQNAATSYVQFEITSVAGASGSFTHDSATDDGQKIICNPATASSGSGHCDTNTSDAGVTVALKIDVDSKGGLIRITQTDLSVTTGGVSRDVLTVVVDPLPATLKATAASTTIASGAGSTTAESTTITATVLNDQATPIGMNGVSVGFVTTNGQFDCDNDDTVDSQLCAEVTGNLDVSTDGSGTETPGHARVTLHGSGRAGVATVTITSGDLDAVSIDVTLSGPAKNLTAVPRQNSVHEGGNVWIDLTVTDAAGNPVKSQIIAPRATKEVVGPGDKPEPIETERDTPEVTGDGASAAGVGYSKDFIHATDSKKSIPACGDDNTGSSDGTSDDVFGPGTDADGRCVVYVSVPKKDVGGATKSATRGEHTINFQIGTGSSAVKASATIQVAGGPASIESDAPEYVDPLSDTTITLTVLDDEGVLVGETPINVVKVAGDGLEEGKATVMGAMTSNGSSTFSYIAGLEGQVVFRVTAGSGAGAIRDIITLTVGEAMPEEPEEPAMPDGDATLTVQGNLGSFSGGSLDDLAAAAAAKCPGGSQIAVQDAEGEWHLWSSTAPAFAIIGFTTAFADGFDGMTFVWVSSCEADAMDSEGSMGSEG